MKIWYVSEALGRFARSRIIIRTLDWHMIIKYKFVYYRKSIQSHKNQIYLRIQVT